MDWALPFLHQRFHEQGPVRGRASLPAPSSPHLPVAELTTPRLVLRDWRDEDVVAFRALNADPLVMRHFPNTLTAAESDASADRLRDSLSRAGFGWWALSLRGEPGFLGMVGLQQVPFTASFTPAVEVGWRLTRAAWGQGFATEAARAAIAFGFTSLGLSEIVSFTVPENQPSRRVMERLGFTHDAAFDFEHPRLPEGHPLRPHVLYRLSHQTWVNARREP